MPAIDEKIESGPTGTESEQRYVVVSTDTHAGPSMVRDLRPYCPKDYLEEFDRHTESINQGGGSEMLVKLMSKFDEAAPENPLAKEATERTIGCEGQANMEARLRDMDAEGVAAEVIFAGGANGEYLPWQGLGLSQGDSTIPAELRAVGGHIWNAWLADFISLEPERHVGVMQIPIWDIEAAVKEVRWGYEQGLRSVNFPAPRSDFPAYNDPIYDPLWAVCEELSLPLQTHGGGGDIPLGFDGPGGSMMFLAEGFFLCQRGLWQMIFGGVFDRFPKLKLVYTEITVSWVPQALRDLDSLYEDRHLVHMQPVIPSKRPSEYWKTNCFVAGSFLAPFEAQLYPEVGRQNLMWGSDYPHPHGTWPSTRLSMRNTFAGMPTADVEKILGLNALEVFDLDGSKLNAIAAVIGPTHEELRHSLRPEEFPEWRGHAFRRYGVYA